MRAQLLIAALIVAAPPPSLASVLHSGLRMAPATPGAVRFTLEVPEPRLLSGADGSVRLELDGFARTGPLGGPGLPERVVTVAVPPIGDIQLTAVGSAAETRADVLLSAVDWPNPNAESGEPVTLTAGPRDPRHYGRSPAAAEPRARLVGVSWLRNQRVAEIAITPASYDPVARTLVLDRRVDVELRFAPVGELGRAAEPVDPFETIYARTLPNYEQGRAWRRPVTAALRAAARTRGVDAAAALGIAELADTSLFVGRDWVKLAVRRNGFHRVRLGQLKAFGAFLDSLGAVRTAPSDSLRLFTLPGRPVIPESTFCDTCELREVALGVVDDNGQPGVFDDDDDYLYFFAHGPNDWEDRYDPARPDTAYLNQPYENRNVYFLAVATAGAPMPGTPRRIATRDVTPVVNGDEIQPATFEERVHFEEDNTYWPDVTNGNSTWMSWEKWFWRALSLLQEPTFRPFGGAGLSLPYADTTQAARLRLRAWGLTRIFDRNNCPVGDPDHQLDVTWNDLVFPRRVFVGTTGGTTNAPRDNAGQTWDTTGVFLRRTGNALTLTIPPLPNVNCPIRNDQSGLAWVELFYRRSFTPVLDSLEFRSEPVAGRYLYRLGPFADVARRPRLFDVTDPTAPVELVGASYGDPGSGPELAFEDVQGGRRVYRTVSDTLFSDVRGLMAASDLTAAAASFDNLRSRTNRGRYVVLYYDAFRAAADSLAAWRAQRLALLGPGPHATRAIPISALYDQFSGGRVDPGAIRSFLRTAFLNWAEPPAFVTLLGDASYDFKNIKGYAGPGQPGTLVPSYENGFDDNVVRQFATDDWMLAVNDTRNVIPDFFGGRIPANDAANALAVVRDKVLAYERTVPLGEYRNRVILLADDNYQGTDCDGLSWDHLSFTTELDTTRVPLHMDRRYVYLHTYPQGANGSRPGARSELKEFLDEGGALFNYFGHGSPFKLTDESVLLDTDAGTLTNVGMLPLAVAASCDVGKFNDPTVPSLGERLVMTAGSGAIAVISATELAFSNQNRGLSQNFYLLLFDRDSTRVPPLDPVTPGEYYVPHSAALLGAKLVTSGFARQSLRKYQVMGDAATVLNLPRFWCELSLEDAQGAPATDVQRGQRLILRGRMYDRPGGTPIAFDGTASLQLDDSAPILRTELGECSFSQRQYRYRAGTLFRGDVSVSGGVFATPFVVPLDAVEGPLGKARAYVRGRAAGRGVDEDGAGGLAARLVAGVASSTDVTGPRVALSFVGGALSVRPDATLRIDLFDDSGILTTGHTPQNGIIVTLDDNSTSRFDVTGTFRYAADSYQGGIATFELPDLPSGPHRIRVSAADNLALGLLAGQHRSSAEIDFEVVDVPPLNVARAYLFPNPVRARGAGAGGTFIVDAPGDSVNTMVRIYSVTGRLVRTLQRFGGLGQIQLPWDGRDAEGDPLATGTYLFKVYVNVRDERGESSARQKAVAEGRLSVLN